LGAPVLRDLDVYHCDQLEVFVPKTLNYPGNTAVYPPALLSIEKVKIHLNILLTKHVI
jgi:hypothetical protein